MSVRPRGSSSMSPERRRMLGSVSSISEAGWAARPIPCCDSSYDSIQVASVKPAIGKQIHDVTEYRRLSGVVDTSGYFPRYRRPG